MPCILAFGRVRARHQLVEAKVHCKNSLPTVPSWPASTTREVCLPVAKELSTAFLARKMAGEPYCSKAVCTICSRIAFLLNVGSANSIGCSFGSIVSWSLHAVHSVRYCSTSWGKASVAQLEQLQLQAQAFQAVMKQVRYITRYQEVLMAYSD